MTRFANRITRPDAAGAQRDAGVSLIEALVSMAIFVTLLSVTAAAVAAMTTSMRQADGVSVATDQNRLVFNRLDKQVRYALAIGTPVYVPAQQAWYVELSLDDPKPQDVSDPNGVKDEMCAQWRLMDGRLQTRTWLVNAAGHANPASPAWITVAEGIVNDPVTQQPFDSPVVVAPQQHQQLVLDLHAKRSMQPPGRAHLRTTFFARNTTATTNRAVCDQVPRN